ncbi:MAG: PHP domain-containing protein [candidate division Zixibacteria bacterium]|nr:PHP domain-containing protein [candidate division Zixibacteria bacterium]
MKIDLHIITSHTHNCRNDIERMITQAEEAGLDAIAITDIDTMSACTSAAKASDTMLIIPGMTVNTDRGTHLIGLFLTEEITGRDIFEVIDEIHAQGGLVMVPYPFRPNVGLLFNRFKNNRYTGEDMTRILSRIDLIEACTYGASEEELAATDQYLQSVPDIPQVAGSFPRIEDHVGRAYVELEDITADSLVEVKKALLTASRTMRFEAYSLDETITGKTTTIKGKRRTLHWRGKTRFGRPLMKSLKNVWRHTFGRMRTADQERKDVTSAQ